MEALAVAASAAQEVKKDSRKRKETPKQLKKTTVDEGENLKTTASAEAETGNIRDLESESSVNSGGDSEDDKSVKRPKMRARKHMWMEPPSVLAGEKHTRVGADFQAAIPDLVASKSPPKEEPDGLALE